MMTDEQATNKANSIIVPILFIIMVFVLMWTPKGLTEKAEADHKARTGKELFSPRCKRINLETEEKGMFKQYYDRVQERKDYQRTITPKQERQEKRRAKRKRYTAGY